MAKVKYRRVGKAWFCVGGRDKKSYQVWTSPLGRYISINFLDTLLGDPERRKEYFDDNSKFYVFDRNRNAFSSILLFYQSKEGFQIVV